MAKIRSPDKRDVLPLLLIAATVEVRGGEEVSIFATKVPYETKETMGLVNLKDFLFNVHH